MSDALSCFKCGSSLKSVLPGHSRNQPRHGVSFQSEGQYGSTVFDPMDGSLLEINICDACLTAGRANVLHLSGVPKRKWKAWLPSPPSVGR